MKVHELESLINQYGDIKFSELITKLKRDRIHECPACKGYGYTQEKYDAYPSGLPDSGWATDYQYRNVDCKVCNGFGYTNKELKPITKIVGYE